MALHCSQQCRRLITVGCTPASWSLQTAFRMRDGMCNDRGGERTGWDLTVRAEYQLERSAKSGDGLTNSHASIAVNRDSSISSSLVLFHSLPVRNTGRMALHSTLHSQPIHEALHVSLSLISSNSTSDYQQIKIKKPASIQL